MERGEKREEVKSEAEELREFGGRDALVISKLSK